VAEGTIVDFRDGELGEDAEHEIAMVMAPINDPDGLANYAISAIPVALLRNSQLEQLGHRMRDAALALERLIARHGIAE
jgi:DNA-binding IclR family transcriptional regulator